MATRIPLVIVNGQPEQLQMGDVIMVAAAQYSNDVMTNGESAAALVAGAPVYLSAAATAKRAQANASATARVAALWLDPSTPAGNTGNAAIAGRVSLTTAQWDAVTGTTGGLAFNTPYYLDPANPGNLTATAPTTVGQLVTLVGVAVSTTDMDLALASPILL
jgi:hypothetical protein